MNIPSFARKADLFKWLSENKSALIAQKKASIKHADAFSAPSMLVNEGGEAIKSDVITDKAKQIKVRSIINTTKILDGHGLS